MIDSLARAVGDAMRRAAREAILPRYRNLRPDEVVQKGADDPVTVADHASEAILAEELAHILPEATIVGEEAAHDDPMIVASLQTDLCWIVDPLDGTWNFSHAQPPFGVIVALAQDGETLAGWMYDPLADRICHARLGSGAFVDGQRIVARASGEDPPVAAISLLFVDERERERLKRDITPHYRVVDIPRCAAEQYPRLALGQNDVSLFERTLAWDHAAGVLWLNEAGGMAARPDGSAYRVSEWARTGLIGAATPGLWEDLAQRLAS